MENRHVVHILDVLALCDNFRAFTMLSWPDSATYTKHSPTAKMLYGIQKKRTYSFFSRFRCFFLLKIIFSEILIKVWCLLPFFLLEPVCAINQLIQSLAIRCVRSCYVLINENLQNVVLYHSKILCFLFKNIYLEDFSFWLHFENFLEWSLLFQNLVHFTTSTPSIDEATAYVMQIYTVLRLLDLLYFLQLFYLRYSMANKGEVSKTGSVSKFQTYEKVDETQKNLKDTIKAKINRRNLSAAPFYLNGKTLVDIQCKKLLF